MRDVFERQAHQFVADRKRNWEFADAIPTIKGSAIREFLLNGPQLLLNDLEL